MHITAIYNLHAELNSSTVLLKLKKITFKYRNVNKYTMRRDDLRYTQARS